MIFICTTGPNSGLLRLILSFGRRISGKIRAKNSKKRQIRPQKGLVVHIIFIILRFYMHFRAKNGIVGSFRTLNGGHGRPPAVIYSVSAAEETHSLPPWKGVTAGAVAGGVVRCRTSFYEFWIAPAVIDVRETGGTRSATCGAVVAVTRGGNQVAARARLR